MSPSGTELLRQVKSQIEEVDPAVVAEHLGNGVVVVDVRGTEEFAVAHIPGAKHVPATKTAVPPPTVSAAGSGASKLRRVYATVSGWPSPTTRPSATTTGSGRSVSTST